MAHASRKHMGAGAGRVAGHPHVGTTDPNIPDEDDLTDEIHGKNKLQGQDQSRVRNERLTMPGTLEQADREQDR
ncbi:MAG: hypothetical protein QOH98_464 [Methylobacteriaceae bacterium]|jgi:hypothetical protein|nr:hypothetical protein [Methylobacteriaceae bacterium]